MFVSLQVTRDEGMAVWKFLEPGLEEKIDKSWGSGYPGGAIEGCQPLVCAPGDRMLAWAVRCQDEGVATGEL